MKRKLILGVFAFGVSVTGFTQIKPALTAKIKTPTALCEECKTRIERYLDRFDGITQVVVNIKKGETTVKYITDRVNIEEIKTAIANTGFDADDIPANPDFYKLLPKCCKKPEDGGIKPKTTPPAQPPQQ